MPFRSRPSPLLILLPAVGLLGFGLARVAQGQPEPTPQSVFEQTAQPFLKQYCFGCHGEKPRGDVNLARFTDVAAIQQDQRTWRKVLSHLRDHTMPPRDAPRPMPLERQQVADWLAHALDNVPEHLLPKDPGRVLIHRLSRLEYNNTVRDLFGVDTKPADDFPPDGGGGGGFDNNAETLFVPPILMERYLATASEILDAAPTARVFFVRPSKKLPERQAARRILSHFATRAYRRPVELPELAGLMRLYDAAVRRGGPHPGAVKFALKAVLVSPAFLFRVEKDRGTSEPYPVSDYELASRLSYFLWASMPDEELFRLAGRGKLRDPKVLDAQVARMLRDPKAKALADSFAGQWLRIRELYTSAKPDPRRFDTFTPTLRDSMYAETVEFFASVLKEDASLLRLLDADYTFLNEELAKHYGIEGVTGPELRRVKLADPNRGGLLAMGSVLTVTSYPRRTSPVLRGKWVMEEVLGAEVPPPPPNAGGLPADDAPRQGQTFRQRLELHRQKPECASCHSRMDPIGFGMENYDAIGRWRRDVGGEPVDATGVLATGEQFAGPAELKGLILARKDEFARNLAQKMLAYALGRGLEAYDLPAVRRITEATAKDGYRSSTLIREIVKSYPFQYRRDG